MVTKASIQSLAAAIALLVALSLLVSWGAFHDAQALQTTQFVRDQIIVETEPGIDIRTVNSRFDTQVQERFLGSTTTNIYLLKITDGTDVPSKVEELSGALGIRYAEPNFLIGAPEADDGTKANVRHYAFPAGDATPTTQNYSKNQSYGDVLNLTQARSISRGAGTTVAVVDTGAQMNHPELKARFVGVPRYDFVDDDNVPEEPPLADTEAQRNEEVVGHGTHVAGIVNLVAPRANLMPLRALNRDGSGSVFHVAEATAFADVNGADVINLSLGTPSWSRLLREKVVEAIDHGSVVVAAAGNYNTTIQQYPASRTVPVAERDGLLAVTSVSPTMKKSDFANYGAWVDIAAPGEDILSTYPVSTHAYWSGTSMAAPFVAGEAALVHTEFGLLDPAGVEGRIRSGARCVDSVNVLELGSGMMGSGLANVWNSLQRPVKGQPCTTLTL
jgi:thermitase